MVIPGADVTSFRAHDAGPSPQPAPLITRSVPHRNLLRREFIGPLSTSRLDKTDLEQTRAWYRYKEFTLSREMGRGMVDRGGEGLTGEERKGLKDRFKGNFRRHDDDLDLDLEEGEFHREAIRRKRASNSARSLFSRHRHDPHRDAASPANHYADLVDQASPVEERDWTGTSFIIGAEFYEDLNAEASMSAADRQGSAGYGPSPGIHIDKSGSFTAAGRTVDADTESAMGSGGPAIEEPLTEEPEVTSSSLLSPPIMPSARRGYTASSMATSGAQSFFSAYSHQPPSQANPSVHGITNAPPSSSALTGKSVYFDAPTEPVLGGLSVVVDPGGSQPGSQGEHRSSQEDLNLQSSNDGASSRRPLVSRNSDGDIRSSALGGPLRKRDLTPDGNPARPPPRSSLTSSKTMPAKLRSALRGSRKVLTQPSESSPSIQTVMPIPMADRTKTTGAKTVQFPASPPPQPKGLPQIGLHLSRARWSRREVAERDDGVGSPASTPSLTECTPDLEPADPMEVLARSGDEVAGTSAGVVESAKRRRRDDGENGVSNWLQSEEEDQAMDADSAAGSDEDDSVKGPNDVILSARMLVRVGRNREKGSMMYDEEAARKYPCTRVEPMQEYLVTYRKGTVELWQDWRIPLKERYYKTKRLCYSIPLHRKYTQYSLFNPHDLSFTLTLDCAPYAEALEGAHGEKSASRVRKALSGTKQLKALQSGDWMQVFVFVAREKTVAKDFCWELWRELGSELPDSLDIKVPDVDITIRLPIPRDGFVESRATGQSLSRQRVLHSCSQALLGLPQYKTLIESARSTHGDTVQLELAWQLNDELDWITSQDERALGGRRRVHSVVDGFALTAPRIVSQLQLRSTYHDPQKLKLADGQTLSQPPDCEGYVSRRRKGTGGTYTETYLHTHDGNLYASQISAARPPLPPAVTSSLLSGVSRLLQVFQRHERKRQIHNILRSTGLVDLRDVQQIHIVPEAKGVAGESVNFEIVLRGGEAVQFKTDSSEIAQQWERRLNSLREFARPRHRTDGRMKMEMSACFQELPRDRVAAEMQLERATSALLGRSRTWCTIEHCHPITHSGRLYIRTSSSTQARARFLVLAGDSLAVFELDGASAVHRRQHNRYSLQGAYVYSGLLAEADRTKSPNGRSAGEESRMYQDGVVSADVAEDCVLVIWFAAAPAKKASPETTVATRKRRMLMPLIARNKLERDEWVWSLRQALSTSGSI